jgi:tRNA (guanine37-N1)-methyltransferase
VTVHCVRVPREHGEATRRTLSVAGLLDEDHEIEVADGWIYVPVADTDAVADLDDLPEASTVVERDPDRRDRQTTPADLLEFDPSYERVGDVVVIDEDDPDRARALAAAVVESDVPGTTVLNRASPVEGELRTREWELLAGEDAETVHREYGSEFLVDLRAVYFSARLATERHRVTEQVQAGEHVLDMFAGVGPFAVPAARRGAAVVAVDKNPVAVEYCRENARRNGVADRVTVHEGDVRELVDEYEGWADRIVMNLPHSADDFLDTAVALAGDDAVLHYYDIQHDSDPYGPGERAIRAAAEPDYEVEVLERRTVRSYAPHELNVCLDVRLDRVE